MLCSEPLHSCPALAPHNPQSLSSSPLIRRSSMRACPHATLCESAQSTMGTLSRASSVSEPTAQRR